MPLRIEVIDRRHRSILRDFRNQRDSLVEYLTRYALRHAEKDLLARTFRAIDVTSGEEQLAGYFTLATASVERNSVAPISASTDCLDFQSPPSFVRAWR